MTLPITQPNAADAYGHLRDGAANLRSYAVQLQTQIAGGIVSPTFFLSALASAVALKEITQQLSDNVAFWPTVAAYAVSIGVGVDADDVKAKFDTAVAAIPPIVTAMSSEYPKDGSGNLLDRSFDENGAVVWVSLAGSSFPETNAALTAFLATLS